MTLFLIINGYLLAGLFFLLCICYDRRDKRKDLVNKALVRRVHELADQLKNTQHYLELKNEESAHWYQTYVRSVGEELPTDILTEEFLEER